MPSSERALSPQAVPLFAISGLLKSPWICGQTIAESLPRRFARIVLQGFVLLACFLLFLLFLYLFYGQ